jgi:large subunit ribosomal protein L3
MRGLVGKKLGMTQLFDEESGGVTPVTVIQAGPCPVVAVRTAEADGYTAVQLAYRPVKEKKLTRPRAGHLKAAGIAPHRTLIEFRDADGWNAGDTVTVEAFEQGERVKVSGVSRGKGFAGTIKRHRFSRGPMSHGSHNIRARGSIGASATPSHVYKGTRMAGQMGSQRVTQRGLRVVEVDAEKNLLLVRGAVPGAVGGVVEIRSDS